MLRQRPGWDAAVSKLRALADGNGPGARTAARDYAQVYAGKRGAMVVDVVVSRQRRYKTRVLPLVQKWIDNRPAPTLRSLAQYSIDPDEYGLQGSEPRTMQAVATNLVDLVEQLGQDEDTACRTWVDSVQGLEHAHKLDPVVGGVSGIGPALFAYMRMRCGADALKPDLRVARALRDLGFDVPGDGHSVMVVARAAASEIDVDLLVLDQLLWSREAGS